MSGRRATASVYGSNFGAPPCANRSLSLPEHRSFGVPALVAKLLAVDGGCAEVAHPPVYSQQACQSEHPFVYGALPRSACRNALARSGYRSDDRISGCAHGAQRRGRFVAGDRNARFPIGITGCASMPACSARDTPSPAGAIITFGVLQRHHCSFAHARCVAGRRPPPPICDRQTGHGRIRRVDRRPARKPPVRSAESPHRLLAAPRRGSCSMAAPTTWWCPNAVVRHGVAASAWRRCSSRKLFQRCYSLRYQRCLEAASDPCRTSPVQHLAGASPSQLLEQLA